MSDPLESDPAAFTANDGTANRYIGNAFAAIAGPVVTVVLTTVPTGGNDPPRCSYAAYDPTLFDQDSVPLPSFTNFVCSLI